MVYQQCFHSVTRPRPRGVGYSTAVALRGFISSFHEKHYRFLSAIKGLKKSQWGLMGKKFHYYSNDFYCKVQSWCLARIWLLWHEEPVSLANEVCKPYSVSPPQWDLLACFHFKDTSYNYSVCVYGHFLDAFIIRVDTFTKSGGWGQQQRWHQWRPKWAPFSLFERQVPQQSSRNCCPATQHPSAHFSWWQQPLHYSSRALLHHSKCGVSLC